MELRIHGGVDFIHHRLRPRSPFPACGEGFYGYEKSFPGCREAFSINSFSIFNFQLSIYTVTLQPRLSSSLPHWMPVSSS